MTSPVAASDRYSVHDKFRRQWSKRWVNKGETHQEILGKSRYRWPSYHRVLELIPDYESGIIIALQVGSIHR
ncbi:hypothetical protein CCACVL1_17762 [Corchorus capsularis]|uniref:Uncharacterized protein n=1 Tax=Corchorus capsularis TaxID=210143 RepID=A0A1R3HQ18_COCAP|nr:hypothetical protein CCACVL1_17762 [Corchorus capsularis]